MVETLVLSFETGGDYDEAIGDLDNNEYDTAMSFVLDESYDVTKVQLYLKKVNTISDAITVRIETTSGSAPSGTLANASATTTITPTNTSYDWKDVTFPASFTLSASTKYWIKCTVPNQTAQNRYDWLQDSGNGYASGGKSTSFNGGAFGNELAANDLYFRVYANVSASTAPMLLSF